MRIKDDSVETQFHPMLTSFLFRVDERYRLWGSEVIITSGSEPGTRHSRTSLHYATPAQAADIRTWETNHVPNAEEQADELSVEARIFCEDHNIPRNWIEIILESDHIHIEYQPKRQD